MRIALVGCEAVVVGSLDVVFRWALALMVALPETSLRPSVPLVGCEVPEELTGPMQARAQTFCTAGGPALTALVIGAFGEWSDDLESFVGDLASMGARALQARMGAPSAAQARSTLLWKMRQEIGMCALRGHAKVIIARARLERTGTGTGNGGGTRTDSDDDGNPDVWAEGAYHLRREARFGIGA
ncbi:hypothetical protein T492DRAFT_878118 [Pavlovales sp. CCMP2436]|nr:hypothetical protein T492DRAFT_878118 [Pavlovales sp. CCMP2436]